MRASIYRSVDGGVSWEEVELPANLVPTALAISPTFDQDGLLWLGTADGRVSLCWKVAAASRAPVGAHIVAGAIVPCLSVSWRWPRKRSIQDSVSHPAAVGGSVSVEQDNPSEARTNVAEELEEATREIRVMAWRMI